MTRQKIKDQLIANHGEWAPWWDAALEFSPEYFDAYAKLSLVPSTTGTLKPKFCELICIAVNAAATHLYEPGIRTHIRNAIRRGATRTDVMEVLQIASVPWNSAPTYIVRDNDRAFGGVFKHRIRAMGIRDRPTSFRSPWQNGHVERLIGSIRRECTDHLIVLNEEHLRRILAKFSTYYNESRTHVSLGKDAPKRRQVERFGDIVAHPILGGLHHRYARI